jgi:hypothetical protein
VCINSPKLWSGILTAQLYLDDEAVARCLRCAVRKLAMHDYYQQQSFFRYRIMGVFQAADERVKVTRRSEFEDSLWLEICLYRVCVTANIRMVFTWLN